MKTFKISAKIAITFFILGTFLFILQILTKEMNELAFIGFYFVCFAIIINAIVLLTLVGKLFLDTNYKETFKSIAIILTNIPVAALYLFIIIEYTFI